MDLDRYLALEFPGHGFSEEFAALVHARTEGSPLFMADLLRGHSLSAGADAGTGPLDAWESVRTSGAICPNRSAA